MEIFNYSFLRECCASVSMAQNDAKFSLLPQSRYSTEAGFMKLIVYQSLTKFSVQVVMLRLLDGTSRGQLAETAEHVS